MKCFLVEFDTKPNSTQRLQYGQDIADVAVFALNHGPVKSIREESPAAAEALNRSGVGFGFTNLVFNAQ